MMKIYYRPLLLTPLLLIAACSDKQDDSKTSPAQQSGNEHFLKDKTQALDKARQVEKLLQVETEKQRKAIEKQSQ